MLGLHGPNEPGESLPGSEESMEAADPNIQLPSLELAGRKTGDQGEPP
jgi:hypothetical protein